MNIHFIFDFDGTLVDSFRTAIDMFNRLAREFNFRHINEDEINDLKNLTSQELIKYLKIPIYKIPFIVITARKLMQKEIKNLSSFPLLHETLAEIKKMDITLGILTSNSSENVNAWLQNQKMTEYFSYIHAKSNFFGKKNVLRKIIKTYQMHPSQTFYIGDETRDIEAAKSCGINSVAVTWGFNSESILTQHQPHFIVKSPAEIIQICHTLFNR